MWLYAYMYKLYNHDQIDMSNMYIYINECKHEYEHVKSTKQIHNI